MAKPSKWPFFLGGGRKRVTHRSLLNEADCSIDKVNGAVSMHTTGQWNDRHAALAKKHKVTNIYLVTSSFGDHETAEFLLEVPWLRRLSIRLYSVKDLTAIGRLAHLESLRIALEAWRLGDRFTAVDFSSLSKLRHADVMMCAAFESLLRCGSIEELAVVNDHDGRLRDLDLSGMSRLRELKLDHCPKLRNVILHGKARIRALQLTLCGSYQADWHRIAPDLRFLLLGGRIRFPLENIVIARKLEVLHIHEIRTLPPLRFLLDLPDLKIVFLFAAPPGPKLSDDDRAVLAEIQARGKQARPT
jgi:hypothetical protein